MKKLLALTLVLVVLSSPVAKAQEPSLLDSPQHNPPKSAVSRHRTLGLISLPVMGLQIGLGLGLRAQEPNPAISLRQLHMVSSLTLVGLGLFHLNDAAGDGLPKKPQSAVHRTLGYSHIALLVVTGVVGVIRARAYDRNDPRASTWGEIHTGLGLATAATLLGAAFTVNFD